METYTRIWDGKTLTAYVIEMNDAQVVYRLGEFPQIFKEYTPLFLSVFKNIQENKNCTCSVCEAITPQSRP